MFETLLVSGASGQLGRLVLDALLASGQVAPEALIATSREPSKLAAYAAKGVNVRQADFEDPTALRTAFAGAHSVLLISTDAIDRPGRRVQQHLAAVAAALEAGAKHLAYTSLPNPTQSLITFAPDHATTEKAIEQTGLPYTIFRNSWYFENLFASLPHALKMGKWFTATGQGRVAYAARADMAKAIAAGLLRATEEQRVYTLTGSELLTTERIAQAASAATGRPLEVVQVDDAGLAQGLRAAGLPDGLVEMLLSIDANTREGKLDLVTEDLTTLTGQPATTLEAFLEANRSAFLG
jgi:NAD(P)H dehydrogenase (quinone)